MPTYTLRCACGQRGEFYLGSEEGHKPVPCDACGSFMTRKENWDIAADGKTMSIQGDTCAGSQVHYDGYFDEGMDCWIKSKRHRAEEMKKRGLEEFHPSTDTVERRNEIKYIRANSKKGDPEANKAVRDQFKIADQKRKRRAIRSAIAKHRAAMDRD